MLIRLAEVLDTTVSRLLGADIPDEKSRNELAEQLARINEQLAVRNRRGRFILQLVLSILAFCVIFYILLIVLGSISFRSLKDPAQMVTEELILQSGLD